MDALADIDSVPTWSSVHKHAEVLDRHPDGKPRHVKATFKIMGITDKEVLEYHWGPRWMVWDAKDKFQQRGQHVEYNLTPEGEDKTRVRFDIILEPIDGGGERGDGNDHRPARARRLMSSRLTPEASNERDSGCGDRESAQAGHGEVRVVGASWPSGHHASS